ncbi:endonuclease/exonuclease/phosphatase family protein [Klebsiella pneumoniae]|uniref:endonuclease/exonuclease/phosphatase family protein n=1 Tax=Enterobacterales TaxID=91347 RepID=UPI00249A2F8F|nr:MULTISPECIES: endonuclease/exonuclease/phosphatase family protein [Enterobacterales]MDI2684006.1 endonuclease/exonuclease/phosphatase family protein [Klebsiella pneumoniae]MDI3201350.1 endonuclease/exonuclease/phosphatase family protein [Serratia ureilytica]
MELNLCWWNIGISPPIKKQKLDKKDAITKAKSYIKELCIERRIDFFAICEISENEALDFTELADEMSLIYLDLSGTVGRVIIDMSIMYEGSKLEFISKKYIAKIQPDERTVRAGVRVVFKDLEKDKIVTFFLSHWPSIVSADEDVREGAALAIRNNIDNIIEKHGIESQIICMGDYNTDPYSKAMNKNLFSTRDYHIIKNKRRLLFNPSWNLLSDKKMNNIGTYHYRQGSSNRWYVFDQMLFSSSFLYGKEECFKLDVTSLDFHKILEDDNNCIDNVFFKCFDHYPIFCRIYHG